MNKKARLYIVISCVICFFAFVPFLVAYSMGYRIDLGHLKIMGTGGIYIRTFPAAEKITIDSKISAKPGIFSNSVFVQSLLPEDHTVQIQKAGYYDYFKTIPVEEKTVTKLENITLFKKSLQFQLVQDKIDFFSASPDSKHILVATENKSSITLGYSSIDGSSQTEQTVIAEPGTVLNIKWSENSSFALIKISNSGAIFYYLFDSTIQNISVTRLAYLDKNSELISFNPQNPKEIFYSENQNVYSLKDNKVKTIIKGAASFGFLQNNILWLSADEKLLISDSSGNLLNTLSKDNFQIKKNKKHELNIDSGKIFLRESGLLYLFNQNSGLFGSLNTPAGNYKTVTSPDGNNLVLWNEEKIYVYSFETQKYGELFSGPPITNCQWLNNDYIIFTAENDIIISEIDYRDNINAVTLTSILNSPKTQYVQQSGKIYVLNSGVLTVSEKLIP